MGRTSANKGALVSMRRKVERRFYEPLLLLSALGQIRGDRIKSEDTHCPNILQKLRRNFVDGIAYICSFEKEPKRVTAVAIEKRPQGIIVWLAANENVGEKVVQFLESVLSNIQQISAPPDKECRLKEGRRIREELISRIIDFNTPRINTYYGQVLSTLTRLGIVSGEHQEDGDRNVQSDKTCLAQWLRQHFFSITSFPPKNEKLQILVRTCYESRTSPAFDALRRFAGQGEQRRLDFEQLLNLFCKLGKHVHIAKELIDAAVSLSLDFMDGFDIQVLPSSTEEKLPLTPKEATVESIIGRMFSSTEEQSKFMNRLQFIWDPFELTQQLSTKRTRKTRVHAELVLINHFDRNGCNFLDGNDKYIGCSKPACYLCYAYIQRHPGRYTVPPSHQKLYVGWRVPDIGSQEPASAARLQNQERILLDLIKLVREDIRIDVEKRTSRLPYHADSTVGMTSTAKTLASIPNLPSRASSLCDVPVEAHDINDLNTADSDEFQAQLDVKSASKAPGSMPDILSSASSSQDMDAREVDTSSVEAADPEQTHAQFDIPSASQAIFPVPDDISSAPALCDVDTGGLDINPEIADGDQSYAESCSSDSSDDDDGGVPLP